MQDMLDLIQVDLEGKIVWKFNKTEYIEDKGEIPQWMARQHHDYQREGSSVGYYSPNSEPLVDRGNTLILCHENIINSEISQQLLLDDKIIEVNWEGEIIWHWKAKKNILYRDPNMRPVGGAMKVSIVEGVKEYEDKGAFCVISSSER